TLQRKLGFAWLYVTHDQTEATAVADRIAVFESGRVAQLGTPTQIYNDPASRYVAEFIGPSNTRSGTLDGHDSGLALVKSDIGMLKLKTNARAQIGDRVTVMFRPEQLEIRAGLPATDAINSFAAKLEASMFLGTCSEHAVEIGKRRLVARSIVTDSFE